jgi:L-seryl-tRNA(Ser) seleniumtransferase
MTASVDSALHPLSSRELLRQLPSVDALLSRARLVALAAEAGRELVIDVTREHLDDLRTSLADHDSAHGLREAVAPDQIESAIVAEVTRLLTPSLCAVINATGVVLHTNLGRAPLSAAALQRLCETAGRYSTLEYDAAAGRRGKRDAHTSVLLARLLGAESAIVVNNNAAAVFLVLRTLAQGAEVLVSRGELVEIGDGFRIPDIIAESGAILREVGTTNRTRISDYERGLGDRTRMVLRVHPSNFRITGFAARPALGDLAAFARAHHLPLYEDLGSGCLADLHAHGVSEPIARSILAAGASLVTFSGDKLLGGPQAGVIAGRRELVEEIRRHPLYRALRVDKLVIAALETTLRAYLRGALDEIPVLKMIRATPRQIAARCDSFLARLRPTLPPGATAEVRSGVSVIGGGSTPDQSLPTHLIALRSPLYSADVLEERLRHPVRGAPVIARIADEQLVLDLRAVFPEEEPELAEAVVAAMSA